MDKNLELKKEKKKSVAGDVEGSRGHFRVVFSREANLGIEEAVERANKDFSSGEITKSDVANFVFKNLSKLISEPDIKVLRALHFDEKKVLSAFLRGESELPEELRKAVRSHFGVSDQVKKKSFRAKPEISTDVSVGNV